MGIGSSQEELASATRLSLRTIQRIENGETQPRGDSLKRLALALGVATEELTGYKAFARPEFKAEDHLPDDKGFLMVLHLSALSLLLFPFFPLFSFMGVLAPLTLWLLKKDKIKEVRATGQKILNFQISWFLVVALLFGYVLVCRVNHIAAFVDDRTFFRILIVLYSFNVISIIVNVIRLGKGKTVTYQPAIPFMPR